MSTPGEFIVNIGDLLQLISNKAFRRVVRERMSRQGS
uniref:Uncharacterized protein n=1 Tax=Triticum urartu TaxID=4572 RepID=A0A8R7P999_TRIUA